jgi:tRNA (guanine-N7-)-methyltransferase
MDRSDNCLMKRKSHDKSADNDFGVPIPGLPLPPDQWAKTGIKQLPAPGPIDWPAWFGRTAPVVLDLGCGNGRFVITSAMQRPKLDHVGLDALPLVIRYATRRANQRGLNNVRMIVIGAYEFLDQYVAPHSVAEVHLYHPQPYREKRKELAARRLVSPAFLALVHRSLPPGGLFVIQSDNQAYWRYIRRVSPEFFDFTEHDGLWPDMPQGRTRREIYARQHGMKVYRATATPRVDLSEERIAELVAELPLPQFDAGK